MNTTSDYYRTLQVDQDADPEVIEAAFKRLARKRHPDVGGSTAAMATLNEAYEVLGNAELRAQYDAGRRRQAETDTGQADSTSGTVADAAASTPSPSVTRPSPLRWLFLPLAPVAGSSLGAWFASWLLGAFGPEPPFNFLGQALFSSIWGSSVGLGGVVLSVVTAPSRRATVASVIGTMYVLAAGFGMYPAVENGEPWLAFTMLMCAVASVVATLRIRDALRVRSDR